VSYPVLFLRVKAMCFDSIVFILMLYCIFAVVASIEIPNTFVRITVMAMPLVLFEPLMVWLTGGSIGHHLSGIRVIDKTTGKNLFLLKGVVRLFAKLLLGFYSMLTMFITKKHQSLHDLLSNSVVVFKDESKALERHKLAHRQTHYEAARPSIFRRLLVLTVYGFFLVVVTGFLLRLLVSPDCLDSGRCSESQTVRLNIGVLGFLLVGTLLIILGFMSKLPGAVYRKPKD